METQIISFVFLITGIIVGGIATWLIFRSQTTMAINNALNNKQLESVRLNARLLALQDENSRQQFDLDEDNVEIDNLRNQLNNMQNERTTLAERASHQAKSILQLEQDKENLIVQKSDLSHQIQNCTAKIAELTVQLEAEQTQGKEKIELLNNAKEQLTNQFKSLANDILEEKASVLLSKINPILNNYLVH